MENTLGKRIVQHRKRLGLTQDQLAEKLGVTAQAVSKWENDQSCPDITILPALAEIFGTTTDDLLGRQSAGPAVEAEVVEQTDQEPEGLHIQNGNWEFHWDSGRLGALSIAILVLATGAQLMLGKILERDVSFWGILWPTTLAVFGLFGMVRRISLWNVGALLFGAYFLAEKWDILPFSLGGELVWPTILVLFGLSLLIGALRKPKKPTLYFKGKGKENSAFRIDGDRLEYSASFSDKEESISMPRLAGGRISTSFGDYELDLSGVEEVAENCKLDISCSFGDLDILVPRRYTVRSTSSTAFAAVSVSGQPDAQCQGIITMDVSCSFGDVSVRYI